MRLWPERLRSYGISPVDVRERLQAANQDLSWGALEDAEGVLPLYLQGRFDDLEDIGDVVIGRTGEASVVRLRDIADIHIGLLAFRGSTRFSVDGALYERAIALSVLKRPGADAIATIERVRAHVAGLSEDSAWPPAVSITVLSDEGAIIRASFNEVQSNLVQGVAAVFVVLLIALSWRAALVTAFALPITLLGALAVINLLGFTQNTLVTLGMVIALGILVDVFILVMEGMHERMSVRGERFDEAAIATAKTFLLPAIAGQATTILAMVPLMLIGGVDGTFIRLIPLTAIACLVISLVVAFAVCIPLSRYIMKPRAGRSADVGLSSAVNADAPKASAADVEISDADIPDNSPHAGMTWMDRLTLKVSGALQRFLMAGPIRSRGAAGVTVGAAFVVFVGALVVAAFLPSIVYPKEDRRSLGIVVELRPDAGFADAERAAQALGEALRVHPAFASVIIHAGEVSPYALPTLDDYLTPSNAPHLVGASVNFRPKDERDRLAFTYLPEIRAQVEEALADEPGVRVRLAPDLGGATAGDPLQIELRGESLARCAFSPTP